MKKLMENWNKFVNEEEQVAELVFFDDKVNSKENQEKGEEQPDPVPEEVIFYPKLAS